MSIPTNLLGRTGLHVTKLGFGAMELRGPRIWAGRQISDSESESILNAVLDAGITFIDTSNDYGLSEERIGKFLSGRRSEYVLATKCGCTVVHKDEHTDETPHVWTAENLFRGLHESLERMKTDYIDVMQLHNPDVEQTLSGKLVEALQLMKAQGKVRWIGISSTLPHLDTFIGWGVFDTFQIPYSALDRTHEEAIQRAHDSGAGVIIRGGVSGGKLGTEVAANDQRTLWEKARLDELLGEGESRTQFLQRFTNTHPGMHTNIVGTKNLAHLLDNVTAAARGPLSPEIYAEAKKRLSWVA